MRSGEGRPCNESQGTGCDATGQLDSMGLPGWMGPDRPRVGHRPMGLGVIIRQCSGAGPASCTPAPVPPPTLTLRCPSPVQCGYWEGHEVLNCAEYDKCGPICKKCSFLSGRVGTKCVQVRRLP